MSVSLYGQHKILDSSKVYNHWDTTILKNYLVGNVQIRHVQINNATWCAIDKKDDIIEISGPINEDVPVIIERLLEKISVWLLSCDPDEIPRRSIN